MKLFIEVTWDNGIDGNDIIQIGEVCSDTDIEIITEAKRFFGKDVEIITINGNKYLKTIKGVIYFWLEKEW
jgi:hypothetical protein